MEYYLGLDGGGSRTSAVIVDATGRECGRGAGGPCNIATCDDSTLRESVTSASLHASQAAGIATEIRFAAVCAGVAGYTAKRRRAEFNCILAEAIPAIRYLLEPDYVAAWCGATEGEPGVLVIAGTGAVTYGRNAAGESWRVDGRGFLLGDKGGGFDLGRMALRRTLQRLDAGHEPDGFTEGILAAIHARDADDLVEWTYRDFQPARIASLAEAVHALAVQGDSVAVTLIGSCAEWLRLRALAVIKRLAMPSDTPVFCAGGMWKMGALITTPFERGKTREGRDAPPRLNLAEPKHDAAYGAALLAMRGDA